MILLVIALMLFVPLNAGSGDSPVNVPAYDGSILNERQTLFFEKIKKDKITTQDYIELTRCNKRTAIRDLEKLARFNLIEQRDPVTGRGRYYIVKVTKGDII